MIWTHPAFDPVAIRFGSVSIHWYGIMYMISFILVLILAKWRLKRQAYLQSENWQVMDIENQLFYCMVGIIIGGRLGEVLFYRFEYFLVHPLKIFAVWEGGMSFHGGLIGVLLAFFYGAYQQKRSFLSISDFWCVLTPIGLALGRLGNFINGELWGRPTDQTWGMIFPQLHEGSLLRHPSQLYEMFLEGILLFLVLWWLSQKPRKKGFLSGIFLLGYGMARFMVEYVREPDPLWKDLPWFSMGQWLCVPMILIGLWLILRPVKQKNPSH
jgi:phosphatidylglycerol:prolipoprotein diacylglycerol transferase